MWLGRAAASRPRLAGLLSSLPPPGAELLQRLQPEAAGTLLFSLFAAAAHEPRCDCPLIAIVTYSCNNDWQGRRFPLWCTHVSGSLAFGAVTQPSKAADWDVWGAGGCTAHPRSFGRMLPSRELKERKRVLQTSQRRFFRLNIYKSLFPKCIVGS